jgi:hypothetical protein
MKQKINDIIKEYGENCSPSFYIKQGVKLGKLEILNKIYDEFKNNKSHIGLYILSLKEELEFKSETENLSNNIKKNTDDLDVLFNVRL